MHLSNHRYYHFCAIFALVDVNHRCNDYYQGFCTHLYSRRPVKLQTTIKTKAWRVKPGFHYPSCCLLYTSDAADDLLCVDLNQRGRIQLDQPDSDAEPLLERMVQRPAVSWLARTSSDEGPIYHQTWNCTRSSDAHQRQSVFRVLKPGFHFPS